MNEESIEISFDLLNHLIDFVNSNKIDAKYWVRNNFRNLLLKSNKAILLNIVRERIEERIPKELNRLIKNSENFGAF